MKEKFLKFSAMILISVIFLSFNASAHSVKTMPGDKFFKEADAVAEAVIVKSTKKKSHCEQTAFLEVKINKILRGKIKEGYPLQYEITDYIWDEKHDCPSVHYAHSPRARNLDKGAEIIVTIKYYQEYKSNWITSSYTKEDYLKNKSR